MRKARGAHPCPLSDGLRETGKLGAFSTMSCERRFIVMRPQTGSSASDSSSDCAPGILGRLA